MFTINHPIGLCGGASYPAATGTHPIVFIPKVTRPVEPDRTELCGLATCGSDKTVGLCLDHWSKLNYEFRVSSVYPALRLDMDWGNGAVLGASAGECLGQVRSYLVVRSTHWHDWHALHRIHPQSDAPRRAPFNLARTPE